MIVPDNSSLLLMFGPNTHTLVLPLNWLQPTAFKLMTCRREIVWTKENLIVLGIHIDFFNLSVFGPQIILRRPKCHFTSIHIAMYKMRIYWLEVYSTQSSIKDHQKPVKTRHLYMLKAVSLVCHNFSFSVTAIAFKSDPWQRRETVLVLGLDFVYRFLLFSTTISNYC